MLWVGSQYFPRILPSRRIRENISDRNKTSTILGIVNTESDKFISEILSQLSVEMGTLTYQKKFLAVQKLRNPEEINCGYVSES